MKDRSVAALGVPRRNRIVGRRRPAHVSEPRASPPTGTGATGRYNRRVDSQIVRRVVDTCDAQRGLVAVYLFGSVARGSDRSESDIDVAVLLDHTPLPHLSGLRFTLEGDLERAVGRRVDLVILNDAPVDLRARVLRDGELLLDRAPSARIAFEVRTRNEAFDLAPILATYRASRHRAS